MTGIDLTSNRISYRDACQIVGIRYRGLDHLKEYAWLAERLQCSFTLATPEIVRRAAGVLVDAPDRQARFLEALAA